MENNKKIVAIIPARGGSKRVPKKNIRLLAGKPLIVYTIEAAIGSKLIDRTFVSTDDEEIVSIAKEHGAEVIVRPKEISTDNSPSEQLLMHAVEQLEKKGYKPDYLVLLQPTSPLRRANLIDKAISLALESNADSVLSVCEIQHYYLTGSFKDGVYLLDYSERPFSHTMPKKYRENGAIYVTKKGFLIKAKNRIGGKIRAIIMNDIDSIDIDEISDFELVEKLIKGDYYEKD